MHRRWGRQATALKRSPKSFEADFFYPYPFSECIKVFSASALGKTRYCAKAEPDAGGELTVVRNDVWGDILIGAIKFCQIDVGE